MEIQVLIIAEMKSDKMLLFSNTTHAAVSMHLSNPVSYEVKVFSESQKRTLESVSRKRSVCICSSLL